MKKILISTLLVVGPVLTVSQGNAQSTGTAEHMETILVTATQQPLSGADLPLAWSVLDSDDLRMVDAVHINEAFQRISGAWVSRGNGQESLLSLRSPVLTGAGSCGAFFMAADAVSLRAPGFCNVNQMFDANTEQAERIEVIKGPATALYGSGAMHGVINVVSPTPSTELDHRISIEGGPHDFFRGRYLYSNTFDKHGVLVAANGVTDDGYKHESGYDQQKLTLRHDYQAEGWSSSTILGGANLNQETAGFIQGFEAYKNDDQKKDNPNPEAYRDAESWRLQSTFFLPMDEANNFSVTPFWRDNDMKFLMHFLPWQPIEKNQHHSYGLNSKWYHSATWVELSSGIDMELTDARLTEYQPEPWVSDNQPAGIHYDYQVDATTAAAWSQARWDLHPRWNLDAGARYEYTEYDYDNKTEDGPACEPSASNCRFYRPADRDDDFGDWSLNAGLLHELTPSHSLFLRFSHGFRAPQATELYRLQSGQQVADLDSEELDSVELGARGVQGNLYFEIDSYYMKKKNVIFQDANRQNVSNARTTHYGVDFSLRYEMPWNLDLALDGTVARHEYDKPIQLLGSSGDIDDNDVDTAPHAFGSLRLGWDIREGYRAELEWVHMDSYYLEPDNQHEYDGHDLVNLRLISQLTPRLMLGLRATNLTDEEYAERADFGFGEYRYFVGEPRSLYVQLEYQLAGD